MLVFKYLTRFVAKSSKKMFERELILIVGPTAVGKTAISVELAKHFSTELISCDSRQFYKELAIGTAKPTVEEMQGIMHHFVDSHSITQNFSAGDFEREVLLLTEKLFKKHSKIIMTGGSGLFVKAITHGLDDLPEISSELRRKLITSLEIEGLEKLKMELKLLDEDYYNSIDLNNTQRIVRALEVCYATGKKISDFHNKKVVNRGFKITKIGIDRPRAELYERINKRVDTMMVAGLLEEVKLLIDFQHHNALQTVGYKELFTYLAGEYELNDAIELIKRNTRRYAKRQLTWFRNQDNFKWFHPDELNKIIEYINF